MVDVQQDLLAAAVALGEVVMIGEDMIVDIPLGADTVEDIEGGLGATLHIERLKSKARDSLASRHHRRTERPHPQSHQSVRRGSF